MPSALVIFESKYGQTAKIAEHVADLARQRGHDARALSIDVAVGHPFSRVATVGERDQTFIIVAPVYFGRHPRAIQNFVRRHASVISSHPCAFISVCNAAADERVNAQSEAYRYMAAFMSKTRLEPSLYLSVAGAVAYPRYGFFVRTMMRLIQRKKKSRTPETKTKAKITELTDFQELDYAMSRFFGDVESGRTINMLRMGAPSALKPSASSAAAAPAPRPTLAASPL